MQQKTHSRWALFVLYRPIVPVLFLFALGLMASLIAYRFTEENVRRHVNADFTKGAEERVSAIRNTMSGNLILLDTVISVYQGSQHVDRNEFKHFVDTLLLKRMGIAAFVWAPHITNAERALFETQLMNEGMLNTEIHDEDAHGRMSPSKTHKEYFPVYFVEPQEGNHKAIGINLTSIEPLRKVLLKSLETGETQVANRIPVFEHDDSASGLVICKPIHCTKHLYQDNIDPIDRPNGFIVGLGRYEEIVTTSLDNLTPQGIDISIYDNALPRDEGLLYQHVSRLSSKAIPHGAKLEPYVTTIQVANQRWRIECIAAKDYFSNRHDTSPWSTLICGIAVTMCVSAYLWFIMPSAVHNRKLNKKLREANQSLETEVSQRKDAETRLRRYARDVEESNEEVKRFAYVVSHDLRAPLVNLKGFAGELTIAMGVIEKSFAETMSVLDNKQQHLLCIAIKKDVPEAIHYITSSVQRMDEFIKALLKLSRIGHRKLALEQVNMMGIVSETLSSLAHQIEKHSTDVVLERVPDVIADAVSMRQVMGNLLTNAVMYLDPQRPGRIIVSGKRGDNETIFSVRDNGRGIAANDMGKVFALFRRAGPSNIPGEGMGLAYVQAVIRRHGGQIYCESTPGVGTVFTFSIPDLELEVHHHA